MLGLLYPAKALSVTKSYVSKKRQVYFVTLGLGSGKRALGVARFICA